MESKTIKLDLTTIEVKQLPIVKYANLLNAINELPAKFQDFDKKNKEEIFKTLPSLISSCLPQFINIISIATDLKKEEVEKLSLNEFVDVIIGIIEVNNYSEIFNKIKKALARPDQIKTK
jgi:hypothetical protein